MRCFNSLKFITLLISFALPTFNASAASVSQARAAAIAKQFISGNMFRSWAAGSNANPELAYMAKNSINEVDYYVFNQSNENGFVIVSGDDITVPVWGYSLDGTFDAEAMPENMKWWLAEFQDQLEWLRSHPEAALSEPKRFNTSVAPMIQTTWSQGVPYNILCPKINGELPLTGCVATAMVQIMKYHRWPANGAGSHKYSFVTSNGETIHASADFSQSTYNWDKMLNSYSSSYTTEEATAVATLMRDAGVSVNMRYGTEVSLASYSYVVGALKAYFDYSSGVTYCSRENYTGDWDLMLRNELDAKRPIFYGGNSANEGHAFVLDGYRDDGYFHINWGWGGNYDSYFLTTLLKPIDTNYSLTQVAIIGIEPDKTGTGALSLMGPVVAGASSMPANDVRASFDVEALGGPYNGNLRLAVSTKNENDYYNWSYSNVININLALAKDEKKHISIQKSLNLTEGATYHFFLIDPNITIMNCPWTTPVAFTVGDWPKLKGDVNDDHQVDVEDINAVVNIVLGYRTTSDYNGVADVNGDNIVDVEDVNEIVNIILNH